MNKKQAVQEGSRLYVGKSCYRGHDGTRYTSNSVCVSCSIINRSGKHKEARRAYMTQWRLDNAEKCREKSKQHDITNHELMAKATNSYERWTDSDIETAMKKSNGIIYDHTAEFLAEKLSRSLRAVEKCRERYGDHAGEQL